MRRYLQTGPNIFLQVPEEYYKTNVPLWLLDILGKRFYSRTEDGFGAFEQLLGA